MSSTGSSKRRRYVGAAFTNLHITSDLLSLCLQPYRRYAVLLHCKGELEGGLQRRNELFGERVTQLGQLVSLM